MNSNVKLLVNALRSGEFKQGRHYLSIDNTYCCLGVACEVAIRNGVKIDRTIDSSLVKYDGDNSLPPIPVQKFFGFKTADGRFEEGTLTKKNDNGMPFEEIATLIESNPKGMFVE